MSAEVPKKALLGGRKRTNREISMPDNINSFLHKIPPEMTGVILAIVISVLRVFYEDKDHKPRLIKAVLEALICGALSLTSTSAINALNVDKDWSIFIGGAIGFFGVATLRALALRVLKNKVKFK